MDRREQRFKKRTAVTKEESLTPQPQLAPQTKSQQQIFLSALRRSDYTPPRLAGAIQEPAGTTRPREAAAPRNGDAHRARLRSEGSLLLSDVPSVHAKMAKYALLTAARAEVPDHTAHAEGSDSAPIRNAPCFAM